MCRYGIDAELGAGGLRNARVRHPEHVVALIARYSKDNIQIQR